MKRHYMVVGDFVDQAIRNTLDREILPAAVEPKKEQSFSSHDEQLQVDRLKFLQQDDEPKVKHAEMARRAAVGTEQTRLQMLEEQQLGLGRVAA